MFSLSGAVETFRRYLLIRTDILQKTVDGCPCIIRSVKRKETIMNYHVEFEHVQTAAYCSLRNEMERNEMERNEMERNEMRICSLRNENL